MKNINRALILMVALFLSASQFVRADDDTVGSLRFDYWSFGTDGEASVHGSNADIKDSSKMLDGKGHGYILGGERRFEDWGLNMDLFIGDRRGDRQISDSQSVDYDFEFFFLTFGAFKPLVQAESDASEKSFELDGLAGLRGYSNSYSLEFHPDSTTAPKSQTAYVGWVDTYIGLRAIGHLNDAWALSLYGDVGGFGIGNGSELSVLTRAELIWTVKPDFNFIGGYRLFDLKSERQSGANQTEIDMRMGGPTLGVEIKF